MAKEDKNRLQKKQDEVLLQSYEQYQEYIDTWVQDNSLFLKGRMKNFEHLTKNKRQFDREFKYLALGLNVLVLLPIVTALLISNSTNQYSPEMASFLLTYMCSASVAMFSSLIYIAHKDMRVKSLTANLQKQLETKGFHFLHEDWNNTNNLFFLYKRIISSYKIQAQSEANDLNLEAEAGLTTVEEYVKKRGVRK